MLQIIRKMPNSQIDFNEFNLSIAKIFQVARAILATVKFITEVFGLIKLTMTVIIYIYSLIN